MEITWHGDLCFTIKGKKTSVVIDPYKGGKHKLAKAKSNIVLLTDDYDEKAELIDGTEETVKINWPGEYEYSSVPIIGITAYTKEKEEGDTAKGRIVVFTFMVDDIGLCHLGNLGEMPSDEMLEKIGDVDVLMISAGGNKTLNLKEIQEVIEEIDPRVVIPMNYNEEELEKFMKEMGITEQQELEKFEVKNKADLAEDKTDFVVLTPSS